MKVSFPMIQPKPCKSRGIHYLKQRVQLRTHIFSALNREEGEEEESDPGQLFGDGPGHPVATLTREEGQEEESDPGQLLGDGPGHVLL